MRLLASILSVAFSLSALASSPNYTYYVTGEDQGSWPQILSSLGLNAGNGGPTNLFVVRSVPQGASAQWIDKIEQGGIVILEGNSALSEALGIRQTKKHVVVRSTVDARAPELPIIWEKPVEMLVSEMPPGAQVFASERWEKAPVIAGMRRGKGAVLWVAVPPGEQGFERFPYLPQALVELGVQPPFRSARLWAFFDSAYRSRVDLDYFAPRWRKAGIAALQVAAWHNFEPDPAGDEYLRKLIDACHRNGILVYAWLELPHVSEKFWNDHPEWREKTALLQDAQLDWRKLMNLTNPDAFAAASTGVQALLRRFDWDGVNLAELYYESLEGTANLARFTPMNDDVRREFKALKGVDPLDILSKDPAPFLEYRAKLARRQQERWIAQIEAVRAEKPDLDLVLTHVDDRFDSRVRELIGADASAVLPMLDQHRFTFLIEDPATIWNLGPQRYPQIAAKYQPLTTHPEKLAVDINIVERYQDVYPTKQQTGTELFQLVHLASSAFDRVALYFENSILPADLTLLPASASFVDSFEQRGTRLNVSSRLGVGVRWEGDAIVDGNPWPVQDSGTVWLPAGAHVIEAGPAHTGPRLIDFNGNLQSASASGATLEFSYASESRALATLDAHPVKIEIDGAPDTTAVLDSGSRHVLVLPRGQHIAELTFK